jgi:hypothetical protein
MRAVPAMLTLALLLALSAKPPVVCVGFTRAQCDYTYASSDQAEQDPDVLKWAGMLITRGDLTPPVQPRVVVCVGFKDSRCDFTYSGSNPTRTDFPLPKRPAIIVTRIKNGHYFPSDLTTLINENRRQQGILHQQVSRTAEQLQH